MTKYPTTKKVLTTYDMHGEEIIDNYTWLEDSDSKDVKVWTDEQNKHTDNYFRGAEKLEYFKQKILSGLSTDSVSAYSRFKDSNRLVWFERKKNEDLGALYCKDGIDGEPRKLIDLENMREDNAVSLDSWSISRDGRMLAYAISEEGTELSTLRILDIDKLEIMSDFIPNTRHPSIEWLIDASGFFYVCSDKSGPQETSELHMNQKLYLHRLGDDHTDDTMIFGQDSNREDSPRNLNLSLDGKRLFFSVSSGWDKNEVNVYDIKEEKHTQIVGREAKFSYLELNGYLYFYTDYKAPRFRILRTSAVTPGALDTWEELVPELKKILDSFTITKSKMFLSYLEDVTDTVYEIDFEAQNLRKLDLPYNSLIGITASRYHNDYYIGVSNMYTSLRRYHYTDDMPDGALVYEQESPFNSDDFQVDQHFVTSIDGTKVPMFVLARSDHDFSEPAKTIVYGYGGFGAITWPGYSVTRLSWVEQGNVYVLANIRGGGEYGTEWHESGIKENKQNSLDDFVVCIRTLIDQNITSSEKIAISGASNGGLLVGATATQNPDLVKAVVCGVPLLDMYKFPHYLIASRWTQEYGDPDVQEDFDYIKTWSPYHLCDSTSRYPSFYIYTGVNDTRVHPFHARKMTAKLQSVRTENTVVLRVNDDGHTSASSKTKIAEDLAAQLAFCDKELC